LGSAYIYQGLSKKAQDHREKRLIKKNTFSTCKNKNKKKEGGKQGTKSSWKLADITGNNDL
jgi:hypothetical protein